MHQVGVNESGVILLIYVLDLLVQLLSHLATRYCGESVDVEQPNLIMVGVQVTVLILQVKLIKFYK